MGWSSKFLLFSHTDPELNGDSIIHMNAYNLKGTRGFDGKFPFDFIIMLEDSLSYIVIIIDALLIALGQGISD